MKNVRTKLAKSNPYYISDYRRKELKYFCLQYKEKASYINSIEIGKGQTEWDDPTGEAAVKRVIYERDIKLIIETAKISGGEIWQYLFKAVTEDLSYVNLSTKYYIPCSRDYYYERYHKFWYLLSRKEQMF